MDRNLVYPEWANLNELDLSLDVDAYQAPLAANIVTGPAVPNGYRRIIFYASVYLSQNNTPILYLVRDGFAYIITGLPAGSRVVCLTTPIVLRSGDALRGRDIAAGSDVTLTYLYKDVIATSPIFKKGRRG